MHRRKLASLFVLCVCVSALAVACTESAEPGSATHPGAGGPTAGDGGATQGASGGQGAIGNDAGHDGGGQAGDAASAQAGAAGAAGARAEPTRLGLHFTEEELLIWRERAENGPFKSAGDAFTNSPGEWDRIADEAAAFMADPDAELWSNLPPEVTTAACNDLNYECQPVTRGEKLRDAAFYALVKDDDAMREQVIATLLAQIAIDGPDGEPAVDFTSPRWPTCKVLDNNPGFIIAEYLLRLLFAYDYVKEAATASEQATITEWFSDAANYLRREVDYDHNQYFVDRSAEDDVLSAVGINRFTNDTYFTTPRITHLNGHEVTREGLIVNNRAAGNMRFVGHVGVLLGDRALIQSAKLFFKEWIRFGVYPDGVVSEFMRWSVVAPDRGWDYAASNIGHMIDTADVLARAGEPDLFEYETSAGRNGTEGGPKNLLLAMTTLCGYLDGTGPLRYGTDQPGHDGNIDYLIDGDLRVDEYNAGRQSLRDVWLTEGNTFYRSDYISGVYTRSGPGLSGYPAPDKLASAGPHPPWGGVGNTHPSKLFQFGLTEGKVWPYPTPITLPPDPPFDTTTCADL